ncbi:MULTISPECIES: glutamine--fructose-6-phosphate transaminase (isomerizing) [unclassified Lentimonas]|uniref:glutamine--fructose-6-phosphate transaminase (isomerizing) n=1 Tax=unclassified Lentimonas TaxID=2630993 RepID=UPI001327B8E1|nr:MULTISPECIES: glutamine--fructose-6-phosphate transaminase (isomerizing) [unclassified Lentimonas]CAA6679408.1 Glucosamine--fructose-6-phosphate aminotransferase [isomerizing] (EC [Lentimonas sp. CC4]CAA6687078.1 Glucosamine--fructose-6-phosphate aminotransferase [isomerizing] (EC [Lentimonas sp. CC6]CAA6691469.1 Glucosamine--fructose-6-phosphate aminotransferase [isomerizing] (EC [Lentimonas sp. CC10]CAA6693795.1 Glucosamine--fructose-6-phosphate aminotransferase [isomerizing] (EC [Lentimon
MCGIVGYIGRDRAGSVMLDGLKRLEYRGYDSSGVAVWTDDGIKQTKRTGRVVELETALGDDLGGTLGISHTRWATHGDVTEANAHPHTSSDGKIALVHNGVIENYNGMKKFLTGKGYSFQSQTDTEALCNLIAYHYAKETEAKDKNRFLESVRKSLRHVEGTYGIAVICTDFPGELIGARKGSPLILGLGKGENLLASDVNAITHCTQNVVYINDNEVVHLKEDDFSITTVSSASVEAVIHEVDWDTSEAELGDYDHFMQKEIFEQPNSLNNGMRGRFSDDGSTAVFGGLNLNSQELRQVDRILFLACGTAWHSCLVAEYLIERFARIPVEVEYASEFRYRNAPLDKNTLVIAISQSGETIDTLGALREARRKGYRTLAINNSVGSTIARESDGGIYQHAGPEIGVASTKAFTSQIMICAMLALYLGRLRDLSYGDGIDIVKALKKVPEQVEEILKQNEKIKTIAKKYAKYEDCLFLGRQLMFPIALEGALKLKEISYIHAEGYPAAEMKHGPIALICEECPSVFLATSGEIFQKSLANLQEVKARKGKVICIATEDCEMPEDLADDTIIVPECHEIVTPILMSIPVQLLSYHVALERGCDVDKPRNLAKSVTVE